MLIECKIPAQNNSIAYTVKKQSHSSPEGGSSGFGKQNCLGDGGFEVMNKLTGGPLLLCCLIAFLLRIFSKIWQSVFSLTPLSPLYSMYPLCENTKKERRMHSNSNTDTECFQKSMTFPCCHIFRVIFFETIHSS